VPKSKLRRLYESDAKGLLDEQLLDDVGISLLLRCESILVVAEARCGNVRCPQCEEDDVRTAIPRQRLKGDPRNEVVTCPRCGWQITWGEYAKSFKRRQLNLGGAGPAFETYLHAYRAARTPQAKLLAIDALIHAFHYSLPRLPDLPTRPAACNLIEGRLTDVVHFLNELTFGQVYTAGLQGNHAKWADDLARFRTIFRWGDEERGSLGVGE
jgi:hypothetical protein